MIKRLFDYSKQPATRPRREIRPLWVETTDERCPLACAWFALPENLDEQDDEPGLAWPVFSRFLGKAGTLYEIHIFPALSIQ